MALSEFHFLLLLEDKVKVVNRISENIIEELQFDQTSDSASKGINGLCSDATTGLFYVYDQNSIFQVTINDEGRDMWKVYLDMKEYAASLANCRDPSQRDQVYSVQAEAAFSSKDYFRAASFYAKINFILSFEVTLKFISAGEQDALRTFLLRKLDNLEKEDKCQITMISTWATELYLDKAEYILDLHKQLTLISSEVGRESNCSLASEGYIPSTTSVDKLLSQLDDDIAGECPFCGDLIIRDISLPFILPEEEDLHVVSWEIKPNVGSQRSIAV